MTEGKVYTSVIHMISMCYVRVCMHAFILVLFYCSGLLEVGLWRFTLGISAIHSRNLIVDVSLIFQFSQSNASMSASPLLAGSIGEQLNLKLCWN